MADSKMDRRHNATKYTPGHKPSAKSEYFGKSYGQLQRESKSTALKKKTSSKFDKFIDKNFSGSAMTKDSAAHEKHAAHAFRILRKK